MSSAPSMDERARAQAEQLLAEWPARLAHTRAVAARAASLPLAHEEAQRLTAAAWLHDVGYASIVRETGFHPLDGARWLRCNGWADDVVALVAHHSGASQEAAVRGLSRELAEFPDPDAKLLDALTWADMTIGPNGHVVRVQDRLREIFERYDEDNPVSQAVRSSSRSLVGAVERVEALLTKDGRTSS